MVHVPFCSLIYDILISSLHKIPYSFSKYPSLKTLEGQNSENMQNTLKTRLGLQCQTLASYLYLTKSFGFKFRPAVLTIESRKHQERLRFEYQGFEKGNKGRVVSMSLMSTP